jgi:hypothetical protein
MVENRVKSSSGNIYKDLDDATLNGFPNDCFAPVASDESWKHTYDEMWVQFVASWRFDYGKEFTYTLPLVFNTHYKGNMTAQKVLQDVYKEEVDRVNKYLQGVLSGKDKPNFA